MPQKTVLISYSSKDQPLAEKALAALKKKNINCWVAFQNLNPTESWPGAITNAIADCEIFLLLLTKNSNGSKQVVRELTQADNLGKTLYCFQAEDLVISNDIKFFFSSIQLYEAYKYSRESSLQTMAEQIESLLGNGPYKPVIPPQPPKIRRQRLLVLLITALLALPVALLLKPEVIVYNAPEIRGDSILQVTFDVPSPGYKLLGVTARLIDTSNVTHDFYKAVTFDTRPTDPGFRNISQNCKNPDKKVRTVLQPVVGQGAYTVEWPLVKKNKANELVLDRYNIFFGQFDENGQFQLNIINRRFEVYDYFIRYRWLFYFLIVPCSIFIFNRYKK